MTDESFADMIDQVIDSPRFSEPVRILRIDPTGSRFTLHAIGVESEQHYSPLLTADEIAALQPIEGDQTLRGDGAKFKLAAEAWRIKLAHLHDPLLAAGVSRIDPLPHQLEAVYERMLPQPALRFMLADDPGAGKTIMAGLLFKELKLRGVLQRTLIVAPSPLRLQWQREMREKFGERFDIIERATLHADGKDRAWNMRRQAIVSMDFVKQPDVLDSLDYAEMWDLIIVDEAHKMSAYPRGMGHISRSQRYRLGEKLSDRASRFVLMTATPHKGDPENFRLLLSLIDPDLFANEEILQRAVEGRENPIFLRRLKEDMRRFDGKPLFPGRQAITIPYELRGDELELYQRVTHYVENNYNRALSDQNRNVTFALIVLQRRLASSVRAIRRSLENRRRRLQELRDNARDDPGRLASLKRESLAHDEEELSEEERWQLEENALRFTLARNIGELDSEIDELGRLINKAQAAESKQPERKLSELQAVMQRLEREQPGEKLLIFTEARDTLDYLLGRLEAWGIGAVCIHGGMKPEARIHAERRFRAADIQVMVATEAAGEGINLQFCHLMVNYDIPWNPTRLEQRLGRIHRYGQDREVFMFNLVAENTREGEVLAAVFRKLEQMRQEMGSDRVYDVIGERLANARLQELITDAIAKRRHFSEILGALDSSMPSAAIQTASLSALATRHINIEAMAKRREIARGKRLSPAYIRHFFLAAFEALFPTRVGQRADGFWRILYVPTALRDLPVDKPRAYDKPAAEILRFGFDMDEARREGIDAMGPGHPLFEALLQHTLKECDRDLKAGALFVDLDNRREGLIWLLKGAMEDGMSQLVGEQLCAIYQPADGGDFESLSADVFLDYKIAEPGATPSAATLALLDGGSRALGYCADELLEPSMREIERRRRRETDIARRYLNASFEKLISDSDGKLMAFDERQRMGRDMRAAIRDEERKNEDLRRRKMQRLQAAEREAIISMKMPQVLGLAAILPADSRDESAGQPPRRDDQIEAAAIDFVMRYEREQGRQPTDRSPEKLPYDITSVAADGALRYIEVKGRAGVGAVELTGNEWRHAENLGADYWLYIVSDVASEPQLTMHQDPVHSLPCDEIVQRTRYQIPPKVWRKPPSVPPKRQGQA